MTPKQKSIKTEEIATKVNKLYNERKKTLDKMLTDYENFKRDSNKEIQWLISHEAKESGMSKQFLEIILKDVNFK